MIIVFFFFFFFFFFFNRSYIYIWIEQRARLVENYEKSPHNALKLMKLIDNNKTMYDSFETVFSSKYKKFIAPTPMHHVDNIILLAHTSSYSIFKNKATIEFMEENKLKHQLQDLVYLWDVHNYKISLEKYDQSEPEGIGNFLFFFIFYFFLFFLFF